jgi:hypothetical protein
MALRKPSRKPLPARAARPAMAHDHSGDNCPVCTTCCGCHLFGLFTSGRMWLMALVSIVLVIGFDWLWNTQVMMPDYIATASFWRPMGEMRVDLIFLADGLIGLVYAMLFRLTYRGSGLVEGLKNGLLIAAPLAICSGLVCYATQPLPEHLVQLWALGALLQGALVGLVLSLISCCGCRK